MIGPCLRFIVKPLIVVKHSTALTTNYKRVLLLLVNLCYQLAKEFANLD